MLDYLVKPVSRTRITVAIARLVEHHAQHGPPGAADDDVISVDTIRGGGTRLLPVSSIRFVEAHGDYARIHADDGRFLLRASLGELERRWQPAGFARVHRGYLVPLRRATELRPQRDGSVVLVVDGGDEVPVARRQVAELRRRLRA